MKTVAKKVAKKAPAKPVKAVKVASKSTPKAVVKKPAAKPMAKPVKKITVKPVTKAVSKPVSKAVAKKAVKAVKAVAKTSTKPATKSKTSIASKSPKVTALKKKIAVPDISVKKNKVTEPIKLTKSEKTTKAAKAGKTSKVDAKGNAVKLEKTVTKPIKAESQPKKSMVIAPNIEPTQATLTTKITAIETTPAAPVLSKARTSRLASLTVPSMAQSIASTAAKSSYGPAVHAQTIIVPPQNAPKQNPKLANNWKNKTAEEMTNEEVLAMPESEYMNIKQMMYFRLKLIELKKGILESAGATTEHLRDDSAVVPDPTDRATIEEEHALELRTRDRERKLLKKIEQSIVRIDAGDYGYCDETGEAIGVGRLLARPTATLSLEAQQRRELKQKMFGD
jgi:DnaK suppressor protein